MQNPQPILKDIDEIFSLHLQKSISLEELRSLLTVIINDLIQNNFEKLVSILYRLDISEERLKGMLAENKNQNAAEMIADLIIERQMQKAETRKKFQQRPPGQSEDAW